MKTKTLALALALSPVMAAPALIATTPAAAQSRAAEARWRAAERRFEREREIYERERDIYERSRRGGYGGGYGYRDRDDDRYYWRDRGGADWEPSRYYREDPRYEERYLTSSDEVYRGADGRYYCRRSDGTTGLVVGAGVGALIGRGIDGGRNRAGGTIVGGVLGALIGREVERSSDVRCR